VHDDDYLLSVISLREIIFKNKLPVLGLDPKEEDGGKKNLSDSHPLTAQAVPQIDPR
jgi:hypothetical protein